MLRRHAECGYQHLTKEKNPLAFWHKNVEGA